jgi:hypothetical protein
MPRRHLFYSLFLVILVSNSVFAQTSPTESAAEKEKAQKEREKKAVELIEEIASEISFLKFSDNRALVLASVADLLWKRDEKRARQLFRQSAHEIVASNNLPPESSNMPMAFNFSRNASPRQQILMTVAARDAELALELLYLTRPADVAAALAAYAQQSQPARQGAQTPAASMEQAQNRFLAEGELRLEQSFSMQAAANDPKLAAKLLRESMSKNGVTSSAFGVVQRINQKDNELAVKLLEEIAGRLSGETLDTNSDKGNLIVSFLRSFYSNPPQAGAKPNESKPLKLEDKTAKDLANKLADYFMKAEANRSMNVYFQFRTAMTVLEKIIPERMQLLKQKQEAIKKSLPQEMAANADLFSGNDNSPEKMIANANRMPEQTRGFMYRSAINQAVGEGKADAIRAALNQAPAGKQRDDALVYLDSKIAETRIKDGKIDEARKIIDSLASVKEKVERLVQMAISFHQKDTKEDRETAAKLMTEARSLIDYSPQDEDAVGDFLRIASGYAYIEPDTAFSMLDAFADQTNELVNAAATVAKFDKNNPNFKNGELILTRGLPRIGGSVLRYGKEAQMLANHDIDRLERIADKFQRPDARVLLKLYIAQAFFTGRIGLQGAPGAGAENFQVITFSN